ncbi:ADP-ribosylglycohydrolase family protein [Mycobacterium sp. 29Ha]|uniref:ADP-ribosylglycohydrolase family protein n=1 Tax=Mycobacterium sp. 29Ha TaxID=2939268 RepID=UPI00293939C7|nr:ADP-ribosylglycohydrolase family protein [Mycobacterium sp. 29Ha]MDV3135969.1 ADP-ribosylglycohydrolase family protein [Mycobacterium sp. 29Ha]
MRPKLRDRFRGCLLGGAVGDALGAPVEFYTRDEILAQFGPQGISGYAAAYGGIGTITDDTQMTMFTAEGLLRCWVRGCLKGLTTHTGVTANAYLRWLRTQGETTQHGVGVGQPFEDDAPAGWLYQQHQLHARRAPGNTCVSALQQMRGLSQPADNNSKGCGGVMRVAPVGLFVLRLPSRSLREAFDVGVDLAALTHGHPTGTLSAGFFAGLVYLLAQGVSLIDALPAAKWILHEIDGHGETLMAVEAAEAAAQSGGNRSDAIAELGKGWVADEALSIALYCALTAQSFADGVVAGVNHDGDSDSTGSMAGNLLGAIHGASAIGDEWLTPLELRAVITELADDLYEYPRWHLSEYDPDEETERIWHKYPGY